MDIAILVIGIVIMIFIIAIGTFVYFKWETQMKIADYKQGLMESIYDVTVPLPLPPKKEHCDHCPEKGSCIRLLEPCSPCTLCEKRRTCKTPCKCPERYTYYNCATPIFENGKVIKPCEVCQYGRRVEKSNGKVEYACLYNPIFERSDNNANAQN